MILRVEALTSPFDSITPIRISFSSSLPNIGLPVPVRSIPPEDISLSQLRESAPFICSNCAFRLLAASKEPENGIRLLVLIDNTRPQIRGAVWTRRGRSEGRQAAIR